MDKYEYKTINDEKYEISYYHFKIGKDIFLCRVTQEIECGECYFDIATTAKEYESEDLYLDEDVMIYKSEFDALYEKYEHLFEIDTF